MSLVRIDERVLVTVSAKECTECGAELRIGPARCPLCGADSAKSARSSLRSDVESYHTNVRQLREQLKRLRDDAEAV